MGDYIMQYRRIRDLREDNDLTQKQVAQNLNCSQQVYSNYELGQRDIPTDILIKLSEFYDVSTDYILGLSDDPKKRWWHILHKNYPDALGFRCVGFFYHFRYEKAEHPAIAGARLMLYIDYENQKEVSPLSPVTIAPVTTATLFSNLIFLVSFRFLFFILTKTVYHIVKNLSISLIVPF